MVSEEYLSLCFLKKIIAFKIIQVPRLSIKIPNNDVIPFPDLRIVLTTNVKLPGSNFEQIKIQGFPQMEPFFYQPHF